MNDDVIRRCILEFYEVGLPEYVRRDADVPTLKDTVTTIVGGRKVGKTYRTYQFIGEAIQAGLIPSLEHVCYLHFDDERLLEMQTADLRRIDEVFLELSRATAKTGLLFVFDEIHRIPDWEYFALRLKRNPNWHVLVTGSSAELEEGKVGRQLRGKTVTVRLAPLSFREFLRFKGEEPQRSRYSTSAVAKLNGLLGEYMETGCYPAAVGLAPAVRRELLRQYFNSIVAADFVDRLEVKHPLSCKLFLRNLLHGNACPYTHKKARNNLASIGHPLAPNTITDWFSAAQDSYLIGTCAIHSSSVKRREQNYRKPYAIDWAMARIVSDFAEPRVSRILEALVYWQLRRSGLLVSYDLVGPDKHEVDFVVAESGKLPHQAIQVCVDLSDATVAEREERAFAQLADRLGPEIEPLIITLRKPPAGARLRMPVVRAWDWLLNRQPVL